MLMSKKWYDLSSAWSYTRRHARRNVRRHVVVHIICTHARARTHAKTNAQAHTHTRARTHARTHKPAAWTEIKALQLSKADKWWSAIKEQTLKNFYNITEKVNSDYFWLATRLHDLFWPSSAILFPAGHQRLPDRAKHMSVEWNVNKFNLIHLVDWVQNCYASEFRMTRLPLTLGRKKMALDSQ